MSKKNKPRCYECGEKLTGEEIELPYLTPNGDSLCYSCYENDYCFWCFMCEELEDIRFLGAIGLLLVCVNTEYEGLGGLKVGIYEVLRHPYWANGMIESRIYPDTLKLLTTDLYGLEGKLDGYSVGHLCRDCSHRIKSDVLHNSLGCPMDMDHNCLYCDEPLSVRELKLPHRDDDGDLICGRCWWATKDDSNTTGEPAPA